MACKILREFLSIYYGKIKESVLFSVNIRQKSEVESRFSESKCNIIKQKVINLKLILKTFNIKKDIA